MNPLHHTNNTGSFDLSSGLNSPVFALAPMDGYTDIATRLITYKYSPEISLFFTEFINVQGLFAKPSVHLTCLLYPNIKLNPLKFKRFPCTIGQIFGNTNQLEYFYKASIAIYLLGLNGIDLNMGCPAKNILKHRSGSALIGQKDDVKRIIDKINLGIQRAKNIVKNGDSIEWLKRELNLKDTDINKFDIRIPDKRPVKKTDRITDKRTADSTYRSTHNLCNFTISLKTRLGLNSVMPDDWWLFLDSLNLDFITIHARTVNQGYRGIADINTLKSVVALFNKTPIIGNGDILKEYTLEKMLSITPFGIMIGRALMGKPYLLHEFLKTGATLKDIPNIISNFKGKSNDIKHEHLNLAQKLIPKYRDNPNIFLKFRYL